METKSWKDIKDNVYGEQGTLRRDELDRDFEGKDFEFLAASRGRC